MICSTEMAQYLIGRFEMTHVHAIAPRNARLTEEPRVYDNSVYPISLGDSHIISTTDAE